MMCDSILKNNLVFLRPLQTISKLMSAYLIVWLIILD